MTDYAKIHDLEILDTSKLRFSDVRKNLQMSDGIKRITNVTRAPVINFVESDHEKFAQIKELLSNSSFSPIQISDDYSVDYYGDPVNFRHTLGGKDGNVRKFSITVQNDYWKLMMDWTSKE
jgi:DNA integrity scanning protein DisA with diadenylate cyclase activity